MAYAAAVLSDVTAFRDVGLRDYRRSFLGNVALGVAAIATVGASSGAVTVAAAWLVAGAFSTTSNLQSAAPIALQTMALARPYRRLASATLMPIPVPEVIHSAKAPAPVHLASLAPVREASHVPAHEAGLAPAREASAAPMREARLNSIAAPLSIPVKTLTFRPPPERAEATPLPEPRPRLAPRLGARADIARGPAAPAEPAAPEITGSISPGPHPAPRREARAEIGPGAPPVPAAPEITGSISTAPPAGAYRGMRRASLPPMRSAPDDPVAALTPESRTAVYDIEAHVVYLPDGERLEAHSGLGGRLDNPRFVSDKARGPTPPNVYTLTLRSGLFHGVQALRLNPVDDRKMYGRDGILAHTYMLGPSGQSFGCVSFKDYRAFLHAFLSGQINRIVVVPHLKDKPPFGIARASLRSSEHYALNDW